MKSRLLFFGLLLLSLSVLSQEKVKKGFGFGALPAVSFDSDLGFQYGAIVNLFHYGDGTARHGVGVVITEVIMEATTDTTIIGEEVTDMPIIHLLTSTCQMAVRLLDRKSVV